MNFAKIAIIGPGLLGGSIALALRARTPAHIAVWARRAEAVAEIEAAQIADLASTELAPIVAEADLIVLCVPIGNMPALAAQIVPLAQRGALVTDVGSVKSPVVAALAPLCAPRCHFVGSHPMAGSELTGLAAARRDLFENAACIVTPDASCSRENVAAIASFWKMLGGRVLELSPAEHDRVVAAVSHLPHLVAATIVNLALAENPRALEFGGPGFRDTTRVAAGAPAMWTEIFAQNRGPLKKSVNAMIEKLRDLAKLLDDGDAPAMEKFLTEAKTHRDFLKANTTR